MTDNCKSLALKVKAVFQQGLPVDDSVRHFIDSTFASPSPEELADILNNDPDGEGSPLMELLCFPDQTIQISLEKYIESADFQAADDKLILNDLKSLKTHIRLSKNEPVIEFPVPDWAAAQFLARLRLSQKNDPRLIEAIYKNVPEPLHTLFKVMLRNSRFSQTDKNVAFLGNFFKRIHAEAEELTELTQFVLKFLSEIQSETQNIYTTLMNRKKQCFRSIHQAKSFEKQLKRSNMETLMLQGVRPPYLDPKAAQRNMHLIDKIAYAVFGRSEQFDLLDEDSADVSVQSHDIDSVIQKLS